MAWYHPSCAINVDVCPDNRASCKTCKEKIMKGGLRCEVGGHGADSVNSSTNCSRFHFRCFHAEGFSDPEIHSLSSLQTLLDEKRAIMSASSEDGGDKKKQKPRQQKKKKKSKAEREEDEDEDGGSDGDRVENPEAKKLKTK